MNLYYICNIKAIDRKTYRNEKNIYTSGILHIEPVFSVG